MWVLKILKRVKLCGQKQQKNQNLLVQKWIEKKNSNSNDITQYSNTSTLRCIAQKSGCTHNKKNVKSRKRIWSMTSAWNSGFKLNWINHCKKNFFYLKTVHVTVHINMQAFTWMKPLAKTFFSSFIHPFVWCRGTQVIKWNNQTTTKHFEAAFHSFSFQLMREECVRIGTSHSHQRCHQTHTFWLFNFR